MTLLVNITHAAPGAIPEHLPSIRNVCPDCKRISAFLRAFREFGYSTLTWEETAASYDRAMLGTHAGDIIAMLARRQLVEAGIVEDEL